MPPPKATPFKKMRTESFLMVMFDYRGLTEQQAHLDPGASKTWRPHGTAARLPT